MTGDTCTDCGVGPSLAAQRVCAPCKYARTKKPCPGCAALIHPNATTCRSCRPAPMGEDAPGWKGGRHVTKQGYVKLYRPEHPRANKDRYIWEHVLVLEAELGRRLYPGENVHHKNGVRDDNRPENLELWTVSQPAGQRVADKIAWAKEFLAMYGESL